MHLHVNAYGARHTVLTHPLLVAGVGGGGGAASAIYRIRAIDKRIMTEIDTRLILFHTASN